MSSSKEDLQHAWVLYSMQGESRYFDKSIDIFLELHQKYLTDRSREGLLCLSDEHFVGARGDSNILAGPHLSNLPDGFLPAIGRSLHRCTDSFLNKPNIAEEEVAFAVSLVRCLIVICRNVDNLPQLTNTTCVGDTLAVAQAFVADELHPKWQLVRSTTKTFVHTALFFARNLYDPYALWYKYVYRLPLSGESVIRPPNIHPDLISLIPRAFERGVGHADFNLVKVALDCLGAVLAGSKANGVQISSEKLWSALMSLLSNPIFSGDSQSEMTALTLKCASLFVHTLHNAEPTKCLTDVCTVFASYLQTLRGLPVTDDKFLDVKLSMLNSIQNMLECSDQASLQSLFIGVGVFEQLVQIIQQGADVVSLDSGMAQAVASVKVLVSILHDSAKSKELFEERISYRMLLDVLATITDPSREFLDALFELVVESPGKNSTYLIVANPDAAVMLLDYTAVLRSPDLQLVIITKLTELLSKRMHSRIQCSSVGMLKALLNLFKNSPQLRSDVADRLVCLFEILASHSIEPKDLKDLMVLLKSDQEGFQPSYIRRLVHSISVIAGQNNGSIPFRYFDIQNDLDGITVPAIKKKWPGPGFTFHAWVCLDNHPVTSSVSADSFFLRRILYCVMNNDASGFEAFFTYDCVLVIAISLRKEYIALSLTDHPLRDCRWHCIDVIHAPPRRPFGNSTLIVYIDGRHVHSTNMKLPSLSEPFVNFRIGAAPFRSTRQSESVSHVVSNAVSHTPPSPMSPKLPCQELFTIQRGSQDHIFGTPVSLKGQLNSVSIFHDAVSAEEAKQLFDGGPNIVFRADDAGDLTAKLFVYYNSNGCQNDICSDLSPQRLNDGVFTGKLSTAWCLSNSLACIGGLIALFPLLEQADSPIQSGPSAESRASPSFDSDHGIAYQQSDSVDTANPDWIVVERKSSSERMETNPVSSFLALLRKILVSSPELQEELLQQKSLSIIGYLLGKLSAEYIDVDVLFSVQMLTEAAQGGQVWVDFLLDVYQYILFDFRIWTKADFMVRLGHLQFLRRLIKDERKYFRRRFGVQLYLDALRSYYSNTTSISISEMQESALNEADILRKHTFDIIQEFISHGINHYEVRAIVDFLLAVKEQPVLEDMLDVLISVLDTSSKSDQIFLLMFEPHAAESLFCLLLKRSSSPAVKSKVIVVFELLLKSGKVYEKSKVRLRLLEIGISGLLMMMPAEVPQEFVKLYLDQYFLSTLEHPAKYGCILALFNRLHHASLSLKMELARKFLYAIYMKPGAATHIAAQSGWYHSLVGLLVETPLAVTPTDAARAGNFVNLIDLKSPEDEMSLDDFVDASSSSGRLSVDVVDHMFRQSDETAFDRMSIDGTILDEKVRSHLPSEGDDTLPNSPRVGRSSTVRERTVSQNTADDSSIQDPFTFLDDSLASAGRPESATDDLCSVVLNILSTVLWQGIDGAATSAWGKRAEVVVSLDMTALSNQLYRKPEELKRRLYELAVIYVTADIKKDPIKVANIENADLVVRLVHDFVTAPDLRTNLESKLSEKLIEDFSALLDIMKVWETSGADGWSETLQMGIDVLLTVMRCPDLRYCSVVVPKLHYILQRRITCSRREICYILYALNDHLNMSMDMSNNEHFSSIVPVLKIVLEKWSTVLSSVRHLPNIPVLTVTPQTLQSLQKYFRTPEWGGFIINHISPAASDYKNSVYKSRKAKMGEFWNEAQDGAMSQLHNRNKASGESKLRFQAEYVDPARRRMQEEMQRFSVRNRDEKSQMVKTMRKWEEQKRYLFRERGPWHDARLTDEVPLRMSHHENFARMRLKLVENLEFDDHLEAAQLRDNTTPQMSVEDLPLVIAKEARVEAAPSEDSLLDEEILSEPATPAIKDTNTGRNELDLREKPVLVESCDLITITNIVHGKMELTTQRIKFHAVNPAYDTVTGETFSFEIALNSLREIHLRRYNLRKSALEMFLVDQTNYFLNFNLQSRNEVYRRVIALRPPARVYLKHSSPAFLFRASGLTQKWVHREMSNFEYLMALNTIAGRTYNDLSQYPVFPWVLRDYVSVELDLDSPATFREFSRPMGVQNPKSIPEVKNKFDNFEDPTGTIEPFHYGQHYSNPASVIHYLVRLEPFTTLHVQLQSGRFDVADRQFHSIVNTWDLLWSNPNDVKELIPEFFYLPEFLLNMNHFDLGQLQQSKLRIDDVILPAWAKTPEEFVYLHRQALESDYVSAHLNDWIDLIFGYKQQGAEAVEALNVFYYCTYEGAVNLDAIADITERLATEGMINNFGQTPCQLLDEPHPRRLTTNEAIRKFATVEGKLLNVFQHTKYLKAFLVEANVEGDPLVSIAVSKTQPKALLQQTIKSDLISVGRSGALGTHVWTPYDRTSPKNMLFERDPAVMNSRYTRSIAGPFHPSLTIGPNLFAYSTDLRLLFYGGNWDNSLRVHSFAKGKVIAQVIRHKDLVTCLAMDSLGMHLVSGSRDATCMIWEVQLQSGAATGIHGKPLQTLYGHDAAVTCVAISLELDMVVSGSMDSTVIMHTVRQGLYVRTLRPTRTIPPSPRSTVCNIGILYDGKIVASCFYPECRIARNSLELYSINGKHLFTDKLSANTTDLKLVDDYVITGDAEGRIEIREWFQLKLLYSMQLATSVSSLYIPKSSSHILAGLADGKLIIIAVPVGATESILAAGR